jgi:LmbE family N-acetylglucosaminyl deacetylase
MDLTYFSGRLLVISPHPDDACFSAGGLLLKKTSEEVTILTVFSKGHPHLELPKPFSKVTKISNLNPLRRIVVEVFSKERQMEDRRFCASLRAVQKKLHFKNSSLRGYVEPYLANADNIEEEPIYNDVFRAIEKCVSSGFYNSVLCPLAVGDHVDHLIVLKAFLQILKKSKNIPAEVLFYEDLPYASSYKLDFISSLARERMGRNTPLYVNITFEMPLKLNLINIYCSLPTSYRARVKLSVLYHAKRLFMSRAKKVDATGYCERFWRLDSC